MRSATFWVFRHYSTEPDMSCGDIWSCSPTGNLFTLVIRNESSFPQCSPLSMLQRLSLEMGSHSSLSKTRCSRGNTEVRLLGLLPGNSILLPALLGEKRSGFFCDSSAVLGTDQFDTRSVQGCISAVPHDWLKHTVQCNLLLCSTDLCLLSHVF